MRRATNPVASAAQQLDEICTLAAPDLDQQTLAHIRDLIDVTAERSEVDPSWCVIGMLGGTGAGKSSLVNVLSGGEVVTAGVRRPTTNEACAVLPRGREPQELLGWLDIGRRVEAPQALPGDTVVVDLPDIDSVDARHADIADRLASRVDALVVVVNPQKYADARLHDEWLVRLRSSHASVTVVLTHIDTISLPERDAIEQDLHRLLSDRGMADAEVFAVSATTGEGMRTLIKHLTREASRILCESLELTGTVRGLETDGLAAELAGTAADLAGAPIIAEAVADSTLRAGRRAGGWLPLRWLARTGVDPLRRLHLDDESRAEGATTPTLPTRSASDEAAFVNAVRGAIGERAQARPARWRAALVERALCGAREVPDAAHRKVAEHIRVSTGAPALCRALGGAQLLAWLGVVVGVAWIVLVHLGRAVLIDVRVPAIGPIPLPTALVALCLLITVLCACASRALARWAASRRRRVVMRDLRGLCRDAVDRLVVAPLRSEDNRQVTIASFLARLPV